jgi:hypothetical protein
MASGNLKQKRELVLRHANWIMCDLATTHPGLLLDETKLLLRLVNVVEEAFDLGVEHGIEIGKGP